MHGEQADLKLALETFDEQATHFTAQRSCGAKPFQRWSWWMQTRGGLNAVPNPESWWTASKLWRNQLSSSNSTSNSSVESWTYVGPEGIPVHGGAGRINRIKVDPSNPDHWYACAPSGGLWHSMDAGNSWEVLGADVLAPLGATDVWVDPGDSGHMWLATGDGNGGDTYSIGVLETWDGGDSWSPMELSFEPGQGRRIHAISPHPNTSGSFLIASDLGVFKTTNGGQTFDLTASGLTRDVIWVNDTCAIAAVENQGILKTWDSGDTWTPVSLPNINGLGRIQIAGQSMSQTGIRDTLYAIGAQYLYSNFLGFWQSTDGGDTWNAQITNVTGPNLLGYTLTGVDNAGQAFWDLCIEVDPNDASRVLVGGVNIWETTDAGQSWSCPIHWQGALEAHYAHADQHDITFLNNGDVLLANDGGVFVWDGADVEDRSEGLEITQGYAVALNPHVQGQWLVGTQDNGTNLMKPNVDARILDGDGFEGFFDPTNPSRLYASAYYGLLYRSDDGGRTLTNIANYYQSSGPNEVGSWQTPFQAHPAIPGRIVAAKKSLHFSDDGGETWTTWDGMGTVRSTSMALTALDPNAALIAKNDDLYWRDSESLAFEAIAGLPGDQIGDVAIEIENPSSWMVCFSSYVENQQVWRTLDQGDTWQNMSTGLPTLPIHRIVELPGGEWVCGSDLGVHIWNEASSSWETMGAGLPLTPVVDLDVDTLLSRLVVSTYGRGVWSIPLPSSPEEGAAIIKVYAPDTQCLHQLTGTPTAYITGTAGMTELACLVTATQGSVAVHDTVWAVLESPLTAGHTVTFEPFDLDIPTSGAWEVMLQTWSPNSGVLGPDYSTTMWSSGLGHKMSMTWWGDCENVDIRWELRNTDTGEPWAVSIPLAAGDTLTQEWCLTEGCFDLTWYDAGGDGFSGEDCGEPGGYTLKDPFDDILASEEGTNFGSETTIAICIDVPWCEMDYNGDGMRSVEDLLTLLSDFGCPVNCITDANGDGPVGVADLMDVLSVYGTSCIPMD